MRGIELKAFRNILPRHHFCASSVRDILGKRKYKIFIKDGIVNLYDDTKKVFKVEENLRKQKYIL